jgi:hypothetical protein
MDKGNHPHVTRTWKVERIGKLAGKEAAGVHARAVQ